MNQLSNYQFYKYQATGNDFVMVDDREGLFPATKENIAFLCHRRFGVGADGLILIQNDPEYDFRMVYFNADGLEGSMCGNGGRSAVRFAEDLGIFQNKTKFIAVDGEHLADTTQEKISLKMGRVHGIEHTDEYDFMNTGSPHYVRFVKNIEQVDVYQDGKSIRYAPYWVERGGTNVNFVERVSEDTIYVRTYERGVEDETFSCGTGVTAAALSAFLNFKMQSPINIITKGGNLSVSFNESFDSVYLEGPAVCVFEGKMI